MVVVALNKLNATNEAPAGEDAKAETKSESKPAAPEEVKRPPSPSAKTKNDIAPAAIAGHSFWCVKMTPEKVEGMVGLIA
jgi:hypothetical protein